ncbi:unnamed protein product [Taenia asiatica]|uniref:Uncharacterized protein n=1 Tax=Taenia asiatica TaxID=60517 RepID=A0A3P6QAT8_TAEAS|nr:unnamed protein product [Taenia asiatica]
MPAVRQGLGLSWLGLENQDQVTRYIGGEVGIAACGLFTSILSSKSKCAFCHVQVDPQEAHHSAVHSVASLNSPLRGRLTSVLQLMLVEELDQLQTLDNCDSVCTQLTGGLDSQKHVHLIATGWTLDGSQVGCESRAIHQLSFSAMSFRLPNAAATFQRQMRAAITHPSVKHCVIYLDDIPALIEDIREYNANPTLVLDIESKICHFHQHEVTLLRHRVSSEETAVNEDRINEVRSWPSL